MNITDIPRVQGECRESKALGDLLRRASGPGRASWADIVDGSGIYAVYIQGSDNLTFSSSAGRAGHARPTSRALLQTKWQGILANAPTDIVYIGKGANLRSRVRLLALFGVGRRRNHKGGEWVWQVEQIKSTRVLIQVCPEGKEEAFEGWLLDEFREDHADWPLANRQGGTGDARWHP